MSAHEEEISAELQYLDCLTTFVKSFQVKCCSTYRCLKTFFSIFMAMLTWFYRGLNEKDKICSGEATAKQLLIRNGFAGGVHRLLLTESSLVLCFRVLPTTCIMRQHLQHNQVTQIVQLLQDGISVCAVVRRFGASPSTVSRTWWRY